MRFMWHEILRIGADAAENAEHELDEQRPRHQTSIAEMRQRIEVADIVAFELEARAAALAKLAQDRSRYRQRCS